LPIPTLDERATLYLRAVHGNRDFTEEERSNARNVLLNSMATEIAAQVIPAEQSPVGEHGADRGSLLAQYAAQYWQSVQRKEAIKIAPIARRRTSILALTATFGLVLIVTGGTLGYRWTHPQMTDEVTAPAQEAREVPPTTSPPTQEAREAPPTTSPRSLSTRPAPDQAAPEQHVVQQLPTATTPAPLIGEKALGARDVAQTLNNQAIVYGVQGKYSEAEGLFKRALVIREKALGASHPDVAQTLNDLALVYRTQGKYSEAEELFKRALVIREKALGASHPDVGQTLNNLALVYRTQGKYSEAEVLLRRVLAIREKALGANHPVVADTLNDLANVYLGQGEYSEAEGLYKRTLAIREQTNGEGHPLVGQALNNLALVYLAQAKYTEAAGLFERALAQALPTVQIVSQRSEADVLAVLRRLQENQPSLFGQAKLGVVAPLKRQQAGTESRLTRASAARDLEGMIYTAQVGPFASAKDAVAACQVLQAAADIRCLGFSGLK
jgi:tetratricopeptide (TPR) repeat protein